MPHSWPPSLPPPHTILVICLRNSLYFSVMQPMPYHDKRLDQQAAAAPVCQAHKDVVRGGPQRRRLRFSALIHQRLHRNRALFWHTRRPQVPPQRLLAGHQLLQTGEGLTPDIEHLCMQSAYSPWSRQYASAMLSLCSTCAQHTSHPVYFRPVDLGLGRVQGRVPAGMRHCLLA